MTYLLGVDSGLTVTKALLYDRTGAVRGSGTLAQGVRKVQPIEALLPGHRNRNDLA